MTHKTSVTQNCLYRNIFRKTERRQNKICILRALASYKKEEQRKLLTTAVIHTYAVDIKTKLNLIYVCKGALRIVSRLHHLLT